MRSNKGFVVFFEGWRNPSTLWFPTLDEAIASVQRGGACEDGAIHAVDPMEWSEREKADAPRVMNLACGCLVPGEWQNSCTLTIGHHGPHRCKAVDVDARARAACGTPKP